MYLTVKQQVKSLSKNDYRNLRELCHIAKNLVNEATYNIRQYFFSEKKYLNYKVIHKRKHLFRAGGKDEQIFQNKKRSLR